MSRTRFAIGAVVAGLALVACGDSDGAERDEGIQIEGAVVGEAPAGADAAVYLDILGGAGDALVGASSPSATAASLHRMEPVDGGGIMYPTARIDLDGDVTVLAPVDQHVMLEGLTTALVEGDSVTVTLEFEDRGEIDVAVDVVPLADLAELLPGE